MDRRPRLAPVHQRFGGQPADEFRVASASSAARRVVVAAPRRLETQHVVVAVRVREERLDARAAAVPDVPARLEREAPRLRRGARSASHRGTARR
jgi:hypothetical protein